MRGLREEIDRLDSSDIVKWGKKGKVARKRGGIAGNKHKT